MSIHLCIHIQFRARCCPCPIRWGWHGHSGRIAAFRVPLVPRFAILPCILGKRCLVVRAGKRFLNFPQATPHLAAMSVSQPPPVHSKSLREQNVASISSMVLSTSTSVWVRHLWAETHPYTWGIYSLGLWPVYATARPVNPQHALWAQDGVSADTTRADSTGVFARYLEDISVITRDPGLLHVDMEPLTFQARLPDLELEIDSSWVSPMSTRSSA